MLAIIARRSSPQPHLIELPEPPSPGAGELLCRTLELGICGTDREILHSGEPMTPLGEDFLVLGHECLGVVEQVGSDVADLHRGDLVVPVVRRPLQTSARPDLLSFGRYTERGIVHEHGFATPWWLDRPEHLLPVASEIASVAVLTEPLAVAEKGVNEALHLQRARLAEEDEQLKVWSTAAPPRVLVTGMGPIGFAAVLACRCRGWPVVMCGRDGGDSFRAALAEAFGAGYRPIEFLQSEPPDVERDGFDLLLECTGSDQVMLTAARWLGSCGVLVWLGSSRAPAAERHNLALLMRNAIIRNHLLLGSVNSAPRDFRDAMRHLAQLQQTHAEPLEAIITDRLLPRESLWHYQHRRPQSVKAVIDWRGRA